MADTETKDDAHARGKSVAKAAEDHSIAERLAQAEKNRNRSAELQPASAGAGAGDSFKQNLQEQLENLEVETLKTLIKTVDIVEDGFAATKHLLFLSESPLRAVGVSHALRDQTAEA